MFFYQVLLTSLAMCFLCFLFFFFKLLSRPFFPLVFLWCFLFPIINFFFSFKSFIFLHLFYALFRFFPVYFLPTLFFVNFILVFSFFVHKQSCSFEFLTLSSFCPQNFALSYLVVVSLCVAFCFVMWCHFFSSLRQMHFALPFFRFCPT